MTTNGTACKQDQYWTAELEFSAFIVCSKFYLPNLVDSLARGESTAKRNTLSLPWIPNMTSSSLGVDWPAWSLQLG